MTEFERRVAYFERWARVDKEFAWRQCCREEAKFPGLKAAVTERMQRFNQFCKPTNHHNDEITWAPLPFPSALSAP